MSRTVLEGIERLRPLPKTLSSCGEGSTSTVISGRGEGGLGGEGGYLSGVGMRGGGGGLSFWGRGVKITQY